MGLPFVSEPAVAISSPQLSGQIQFGNGCTVRFYVPVGDVEPKPPGAFGSNVRLRANERGLSLPGSSLISGTLEIPTADTPVAGTISGGSQVVQDARPGCG